MSHAYLCYAALSVPCSLVVTRWKSADLLALLHVVFSCVCVTFLYGLPCQVWFLIESIPDLCLPFYFYILVMLSSVERPQTNREQLFLK